MVQCRAVKAAIALLLSSYDVLHGTTASYISRRQDRALNQTLLIPTITPAPTVVLHAAASFTAITGCHTHGDDAFCLVGTDEYQIILPVTATGEVAPTYTGCHTHGSKTFCLGDNDVEVEVLVHGDEHDHDHEHDDHDDDDDDDHHHEHEETNSKGEHCHFHAGVEHCVGGHHESNHKVECSRRDRDYNIVLRIGLVFAMLATSFIGVTIPIFLKPSLPKRFQCIFTVLKQFGTGVVIATALVHLFTHASLMFANECLGELQYEATSASVVLAGLFIAFLVEQASHRVARKYWSQTPNSDDVVSVMVLEAGIIFHSLLVGLTLVVAGDSVFITLFIVIVFHQAFEGIALGTRIATAGSMVPTDLSAPPAPFPCLPTTYPPVVTAAESWQPLSMVKKLSMASAFALVTPLGMAIGIGVLHSFNGNDPHTVVAIGTLDALSAGILLWVGIVEMWVTDWMFGGELEHAKFSTTALGGVGLVSGMALMGFLDKWA
ncbi:hypothetical protein GGR55DRAFT_701764 [Xylaria sp. FL0064]|nr:hypothetical protein GGR55DRAFT_701764 [Xylaria sp. FL0064]